MWLVNLDCHSSGLVLTTVAAEDVPHSLQILLAAEHGLADHCEVVGSHSANEHQVLAPALDIRPHGPVRARTRVVIVLHARRGPRASRLLAEMQSHLTPEPERPRSSVLMDVLDLEGDGVGAAGFLDAAPRAGLPLEHRRGQKRPRRHVVGQVPDVGARLLEVGGLEGFGEPSGEPPRRGPGYPPGTFQERGRSERRVVLPRDRQSRTPFDRPVGHRGSDTRSPHRTPKDRGEQHRQRARGCHALRYRLVPPASATTGVPARADTAIPTHPARCPTSSLHSSLVAV